MMTGMSIRLTVSANSGAPMEEAFAEFVRIAGKLVAMGATVTLAIRRDESFGADND